MQSLLCHSGYTAGLRYLFGAAHVVSQRNDSGITFIAFPSNANYFHHLKYRLCNKSMRVVQLLCSLKSKQQSQKRSRERLLMLMT